MRCALALALALAAAPADADDDARALAEAGWRAYQKRDLATAEQLTRQAIAWAPDDREVRGAALYNLGQILEGRGDKPGAIAAYRDSLTARRNAVVRGRLHTLDRVAAESFDPFAPRPMKGPFASIAAYCKKSLEIYDDRSVRAILEPRCDDSILTIDPASPFKLAAPFQELRVVKVPEISPRVLAVKVGDAWYVREIDPFEDPPNCHGDTQVEGAVARAGALQVTYTIDGDCSRRAHDWTWSERAFVVVGVGASKQPSVTQPFRLAVTETDPTEGKPHKPVMDLVRTATWGKDGSLDIAITRAIGYSFRSSSETQDILGHHSFTFP